LKWNAKFNSGSSYCNIRGQAGGERRDETEWRREERG
jgi:hypothetical protein